MKKCNYLSKACRNMNQKFHFNIKPINIFDISSNLIVMYNTHNTVGKPKIYRTKHLEGEVESPSQKLKE